MASQMSTGSGDKKKYTGVRRRKWGKWVSEIRVSGSRTRLWLGSYSTPEAAAVAHDTAVFYLQGPPSKLRLNFPELAPTLWGGDMSPTSVQMAASNAGLSVDAKQKTGWPETGEMVKRKMEKCGLRSGGEDGNNSAEMIEMSNENIGEAWKELEYIHKARMQSPRQPWLMGISCN